MRSDTALTDLHAVSHGNVFKDFFSAIGRGLVAMAEADQRLKLVNHLQSLTDQQLADKNIKRDDIVRYAFRDLYYL